MNIFLNENQLKALASQISKQFGGRSERFPQGLTSLGAFYRVRTTFKDMRLHIHVGDEAQTIWVQNFRLEVPHLKLAVALNEPDRPACLVQPAELGMNFPAFINDYLYCDACLATCFCRQNKSAIENLQLEKGERLSVQAGQMRLRLMTNQIDRIAESLDQVGQTFQRCTKRTESNLNPGGSHDS